MRILERLSRYAIMNAVLCNNAVIAVCLLVGGDVVRSTNVEWLLLIFGRPWIAAVVLLFSSACMFLALHGNCGKVLRLWLIQPQVVVGVASGLHVVRAIWLGQFSDGVVRPHSFIAADQSIMLIDVLFQSAACLWLLRKIY